MKGRQRPALVPVNPDAGRLLMVASVRTGCEECAPVLKQFTSYLLWPGLLAGSCLIVAQGSTLEAQKRLFLLAYVLLVASLALLERVMPHERSWLHDDGQVPADLGHTATLKGTSFIITFLIATTGSAAAGTHAGRLWPVSLALPLQVALALVLAEVGMYAHHRLAHEWRPLWHFHAVHHAVKRLWFVNTGRFHFGDSLVSVALTQPILLLAGAPDGVMLWVGFLTMFIGVLTHCNVEMRFGPLNYVFNTPGLHRWHHSLRLEEGNKNYGENLMLWDLVFGTFFDSTRRPPAEIGIREEMPASFRGQLAYPFRALRAEGLSRARDGAAS
jgi:sterol desaturase/sphingolipid hydroxylase (fatty acid hydroxylase superfamily)